jgi:hypothetical protein
LISHHNSHCSAKREKDTHQHSDKESVTSASAAFLSEFMASNARTAESVLKDHVQASLCYYIAKDFLPLRTAESENLLAYTTAILEAGHALGRRYRSVLSFLPGRTAFSETILNRYSIKTKDEVVADLQRECDLVYSLTSDGWSPDFPTASGDRYLSLTLHYVGVDWKMHSRVLTCKCLSGEHSSAAMAAFLKDTLTEFSLSTDQLHGVVTDNLASAVNAGKLLGGYSMHCVAHILNLAVKNDVMGVKGGVMEDDGDREMEVEMIQGDEAGGLRDVLSRCRAIVTRYHQSKVLQAELTEHEQKLHLPEMTLIGDVKTRWNSTYDMIDRLIQLKDALDLIPLTEDMRLSPAEWRSLIALRSSLKPFADATTELSGSLHCTVSQTLPILFVLAASAAADGSRIGKALCEALRSRVKETMENHFLLATSAFVDPRHKSFWFIGALADNAELLPDIYPPVASIRGWRDLGAGPLTSAITKSIMLAIEREFCNEEAEDTMKEAELPPAKVQKPTTHMGSVFSGIARSSAEGSSATVRSSTSRRALMHKEVEDFARVDPISEYVRILEKTDSNNKTLLARKAGEMSDDDFLANMDPLLFWQNRWEQYPLLSKVAKRYLGCPATSVASESVWSSMGRVVTDTRSTISATHAGQLVFLAREMTKPDLDAAMRAAMRSVEKDCVVVADASEDEKEPSA